MEDSRTFSLALPRSLYDVPLLISNGGWCDKEKANPRRPLRLESFSKAALQPLYSSYSSSPADGWLRPPEHFSPLNGRLALAEIPIDFLALKEADFALARDWRFFARELFEAAFAETAPANAATANTRAAARAKLA